MHGLSHIGGVSVDVVVSIVFGVKGVSHGRRCRWTPSGDSPIHDKGSTRDLNRLRYEELSKDQKERVMKRKRDLSRAVSGMDGLS
jgi:hypothetical protein